MIVLLWLSFFVFLVATGIVAKRISAPSLCEWLIVSFIIFVGAIIPTGFALSALNLTASVLAWILGSFIALGILFAVLRLLSTPEKFSVREIFSNRLLLLKTWASGLSPLLKFLFFILFSALGIIALTNLALVIFTVPNEWDSMTGHLNRAVRYIQHGTMAHFGGTNWNMDTYPKSVTGIQIYTYLVSGKIENAFKFIHHLAYWIAAIGVFGTAQRIGKNLSASLFCAVVYALLPDVLMQAISTETDIVLAAYLSTLLYFLFTFRATRQVKYLYLASMAFGIALGHKVTFILMLPSVFVISLYCIFLFRRSNESVKDVGLTIAAILIAISIYALPTGYIKNIQVYGHPIGPPTALKHQSVERARTPGNLFEQGSRNVVRYVFDFANFDGLRNAQWGFDLNYQMRAPLRFAEEKLAMRLDEETDFSIQPFSFQRRFEFYNANPYLGVFGFGLILPLVALVLIGIIPSRAHRFLAAAFLLHFLALSYSAPYDPFKGRYFISTGLFGAPFLLLLFSSPRLSILEPRRLVWKIYVALIVVLGAISALMTVYLNIRSLPLPAYGQASAFQTGRLKMQTFSRPDTYVAYAKFDSIVPDSAVVALATINDDFEYPLYGKHLTRTLISINPFEKGLQPIPKNADYLFFDRSILKPQGGDVRLGTDTTMMNLIVPAEDYYLRKLK